MFSDKLGSTQAVLDGRKSMARRMFYIPDKLVPYLDIDDTFDIVDDCIIWKDKVGEVVVIAQSYESVYHECGLETMGMLVSRLKYNAGWTNKMFVKADLMIHHIEITNIKVERLQDISDEDYLKEGIIHAYTDNDGIKIYHTPHTKRGYLSTDVAQQAFAFLIDKVSGRGTWEGNPYVFCYEFVLAS